MIMNRAKKLAALKGLPSHSGRRSLSAEEGAAIIDAYRRGVSMVAVAKALGGVFTLWLVLAIVGLW